MKQNIIVDIDNTISKIGKRAELLPNYVEFHVRCHEDKPIYYVIDLVKALSMTYNIVFLTMRPESVRYITEQFIDKYINIKYKLLMRPDNNIQDAHIFKLDKLITNGYNKDNILFAIDDNDKVIDMFMSASINCMKVTHVNNTKAKVKKIVRKRQRI